MTLGIISTKLVISEVQDGNHLLKWYYRLYC